MEALRQAEPDVAFEVFSTVPEWFFADSLGGGFRHHAVRTDVGLAQRTSLREDLAATVRRLGRFLPLDAAAVEVLGGLVRALGCRGVLADISPLGLAVARRAGLPSILVENFTWDFIYDGYLAAEPALAGPATEMRRLFADADRRVRTEPACGDARGDLTVRPVSRKPRRTRQTVRETLGIPATARAVLVTMGGVPWSEAQSSAALARLDTVHFVIPGGAGVFAPADNLTLLPHHGPVYHPDLVGACDAVVGKLGYSTLAEVHRAGVPYAFVSRDGFPESPHLAAFVAREMAGIPLLAAELESSSWVERVDELLHLPLAAPRTEDGAAEVARLVLETVRA